MDSDRQGGALAAADRMAALPVTLDVQGRHASGVRGWVEGTLGWQAVSDDTAGLVPPAVAIRDSAGSWPPAERLSADERLPTILVVEDEASPVHVARLAAAHHPAGVVGWPSERERLVDLVAGVLATPRGDRPGGASLRVGGSAGGVGTTTVVLALAGLTAWRGTPTLAAVRGAGVGLRAVPTAALAGASIWARADALPGVADCRAVLLTDQTEVPEPIDPAIGMLVVDRGVDPEVDILVCRPDAAGLAALRATTAAAVLLTGEGPADRRELRKAAAGRRVIGLPWSARVARAGFLGRVPAGLPGAWLQRLLPLVPAGPRARSPARAASTVSGPDGRHQAAGPAVVSRGPPMGW